MPCTIGGKMRLRILTRPIGTISGVVFGDFLVGSVYEFGEQTARVFLAEGWAEIVSGDHQPVSERPPPGASPNLAPVVVVVGRRTRRATPRQLATDRARVSGHRGGSRQGSDSQAPRTVSRSHRPRSGYAGDGGLAVS